MARRAIHPSPAEKKYDGRALGTGNIPVAIKDIHNQILAVHRLINLNLIGGTQTRLVVDSVGRLGTYPREASRGKHYQGTKETRS